MEKQHKYLFLLIFFSSHFGGAYAQELSLAGAIDSKHAIHMFLDIKGNKAEALYFYDRIGAPIWLDGGIGTGKFVIGNAAEQFSGMIHDKNVTGTWMDKRKKLTLPFGLKPVESGFASLSDSFKCEAVRRGVEATARATLRMNIGAGQITRFEIESVVMPAAHTCNPDHSKLKQSTQGSRIFFESTADAEQRCSMSLRRAGDYVLIKNEGDGCLCGARASIPDVLLNIKTGSCNIAQ
jgi:hypothetical protein